MKDLVLKITDANWGEKGPQSLDKIEWKIYNDYTIDTKISYILESNPKENTYKITKDLYDDIIKNIELAKNINEKIDACDGEAWEFIQFSNDKEIWKRDLDYIYGIEPLEKIAKNLMDLISN